MTTLTINNKKYDLDLKGHEILLEVLRNNLGFTGTKTCPASLHRSWGCSVRILHSGVDHVLESAA